MRAFHRFVLIVSCLLTPTLAHAELRFRSTFTSYRLPAYSEQAVIADLDGDTVPDLAAVTNLGVILLKGAGDGTFAVYDTLDLTSGLCVAAEDLDGDDDIDLVVGAQATLVYIGHGDLTFDPPVSYGSAGTSRIAVEDVVGNSAPDIVARDDAGILNVRPGLGDGTFGPPIALPFVGGTVGVVTGDFDGNGLTDVAANSNTAASPTGYLLSLFLQSSAGVFDAPVTYVVPCPGLDAGRIDGDLLPDLVVGASWLKSNQSALPDTAVSFGDAGEQFAVVGDLDGDGATDVVTRLSSGFSTALVVHAGLGNGTFGTPTQYRTSFGPTSITLGDADGDGHTDAVVTTYNFAQLIVHPGAGDGTLVTPPDLAMPGDPWDVEIAEVTGDDHLDVLALIPSAATMRISPGNGDGTFGTPIDLATPADPRRFVLGDVNGDGFDDLLTANGSSASISVFAGSGSGFGARTDHAMPSQTLDVAVSDMDGDGIRDAVALSSLGSAGNISVFPGQMGAGLGSRVDLGGGGMTYPSRLFVGRTNADTIPDVEVAAFSTNTWWHFQGAGSGLLGSPTSDQGFAGDGTPPFGALAADVSGDGLLDLLLGGISRLGVLVGDGDGTYGALLTQGPAGIQSRIRAMVAADLDGDPHPDLLTGNWFAATAAVHRGDGAGRFVLERGYGSNGLPTDVALGDLDENGVDDAVVANEATASVSILLDGTGPTTSVPPATGRARALAFSRVWPMPSRGAVLNARITLPARGEATLALLDISGRRVQERHLGVIDSGPRDLALALPADMRPGVYWLMLEQGGQVAAARVAVLR